MKIKLGLLFLLLIFFAQPSAQAQWTIGLGYQQMNAFDWNRTFQTFNSARPWQEQNLRPWQHGFYAELGLSLYSKRGVQFRPVVNYSRFSSGYAPETGNGLKAIGEILSVNTGFDIYFLNMRENEQASPISKLIFWTINPKLLLTRYGINRTLFEEEEVVFVDNFRGNIGFGAGISTGFGIDLPTGNGMNITPIFEVEFLPFVGMNQLAENLHGNNQPNLNNVGQVLSYKVGLRIGMQGEKVTGVKKPKKRKIKRR